VQREEDVARHRAEMDDMMAHMRRLQAALTAYHAKMLQDMAGVAQATAPLASSAAANFT
jgi:hypothetical protein